MVQTVKIHFPCNTRVVCSGDNITVGEGSTMIITDDKSMVRDYEKLIDALCNALGPIYRELTKGISICYASMYMYCDKPMVEITIDTSENILASIFVLLHTCHYIRNSDFGLALNIVKLDIDKIDPTVRRLLRYVTPLHVTSKLADLVTVSESFNLEKMQLYTEVKDEDIPVNYNTIALLLNDTIALEIFNETLRRCLIRPWGSNCYSLNVKGVSDDTLDLVELDNLNTLIIDNPNTKVLTHHSVNLGIDHCNRNVSQSDVTPPPRALIIKADNKSSVIVEDKDLRYGQTVIILWQGNEYTFLVTEVNRVDGENHAELLKLVRELMDRIGYLDPELID